MERWYEEEDILGIHIKDGDYWKSIELSNGVIIDISKEGEIIENFEKVGKTKFSNKNFAKFPSEIGFMQSSL